MTDFTASNGITLSFDDQGRFMYSEYGHDPLYVGQSDDEWWGFTVNSRNSDALAEYYRAKEDERLGRWRWPENPVYVVYPRADHVAVVNEQSGSAMQATRDQADINTGLCCAARAYFDAHPEPKPWHDAKEGEVWELTFSGAASAWFVNGDLFQSTKTLANIYKTDRGILSARRIYPESE